MEIESTDPTTLEYTGMIRNSTLRLDGFVRNIINHSKNNRTKVELSWIPLKRTIDEVLEKAHMIINSQEINVEINIDESIGFNSDLQRFQVILDNMINNAIKFQDPEKTNRYIRISGVCDVNNLVLSIEDNGIGIPPEYHEKVFQMFFRLSNVMAGPGIGLYVVKETVGKLQGTINLNSSPGVGTNFTLRLKNFINE
jgi:signal transduction histidine kinase